MQAQIRGREYLYLGGEAFSFGLALHNDMYTPFINFGKAYIAYELIPAMGFRIGGSKYTVALEGGYAIRKTIKRVMGPAGALIVTYRITPGLHISFPLVVRYFSNPKRWMIDGAPHLGFDFSM